LLGEARLVGVAEGVAGGCAAGGAVSCEVETGAWEEGAAGDLLGEVQACCGWWRARGRRWGWWWPFLGRVFWEGVLGSLVESSAEEFCGSGALMSQEGVEEWEER
jgi:hypothetical protein